MTQTNQSGWTEGKLLPPVITKPDNVEMLRNLTTELEMRIERALRSLFTSSIMPWEQWFINAVANPDNRASLGIPNNLEKIEISHLLGGREGFHETFRRTNLERLGIIIAESLRTIVSNPLAGAGLTPFKATIDTLSNELIRELRWYEFDNKLKSMLDIKFKDILCKKIFNVGYDKIYTKSNSNNSNHDSNNDSTKTKGQLIDAILEKLNNPTNIDAASDIKGLIKKLKKLNVNEADNWNKKKNEIFQNPDCIVKEALCSWVEIEQLTYGFWHSYKDPAMNVVLDTLTRARHTDNVLGNIYLKAIISILTENYNKDINVNSCLTLLWLLSVITCSDGIEINLDIKKLLEKHLPNNTDTCNEAHLSNIEPYLINKNDMVDPVGVLQEFKDKKSIQQVISIPAAIEVYAYISAKNDNGELEGFQKSLEKLLKHVLLLDDNDRDGGHKPLKESDWGHLYFMCVKLHALYSFWTWYHADLLTREKHEIRRIGKYWYSKILHDRVKDIIKENMEFVNICELEKKYFEPLYKNIGEDASEIEKIRDAQKNLSNEVKDNEVICNNVWGKRKRIKGIEHSVFLMGGAGFGKTELIRQIYSSVSGNNQSDDTDQSKEMRKPKNGDTQDKNGGKNQIPANIINLTPLSFVKSKNFADTLKMHKSKLNFHHKCVVFIDELHIETQPSVYALLLIPLGEGVKNTCSNANSIIDDCGLEKPNEKCEWKKNDELNIHFVFASSRYQTKREFLEEAFITKNTAMRDFATRIKHWIELPGFSLVPEQKLALFSEDLLKEQEKDKNKITYESSKIKKDKKMVKKFLDLQITSTREFIKTSDTDINNRLWGLNNVVRQNSYPEWLWKHFGIEKHC